MCTHCTPLEPWDPVLLNRRDPPIKFLSFHAYLRELDSGADRGRFTVLPDMVCTARPPWPKDMSLHALPPTILLSRQVCCQHKIPSLFSSAQRAACPCPLLSAISPHCLDFPFTLLPSATLHARLSSLQDFVCCAAVAEVLQCSDAVLFLCFFVSVLLRFCFCAAAFFGFCACSVLLSFYVAQLVLCCCAVSVLLFLVVYSAVDRVCCCCAAMLLFICSISPASISHRNTATSTTYNLNTTASWMSSFSGGVRQALSEWAICTASTSHTIRLVGRCPSDIVLTQ